MDVKAWEALKAKDQEEHVGAPPLAVLIAPLAGLIGAAVVLLLLDLTTKLHPPAPAPLDTTCLLPLLGQVHAFRRAAFDGPTLEVVLKACKTAPDRAAEVRELWRVHVEAERWEGFVPELP